MKFNILLVDDDHALAQEIVTQLKSKFEITINSDFAASLAYADAQTPDLILLDYKLGRQDGVRWLDDLRRRGHRTPVIIMSGYPDQSMAIDFMKRSVADFLEKPFLIEVLEGAILKALPPRVEAGRPCAEKFLFDRDRHCVSSSGERINLTPIEYKILEILVDNSGKTVDRKLLQSTAMGREAASRNALDTHISNLKRKIPVLESKIKVVYGRGFVFD